MKYIIWIFALIAALNLSAVDLYSLFSESGRRKKNSSKKPHVEERQSEKSVEEVNSDPADKIIIRPTVDTIKTVAEKPVEKVVTNNTVERVVEKPVEKVVTNTVERVVEKPMEKVVTNTVERVVEKPVERIVYRVVTNVVEKIVVDRDAERKLKNENLRLEAESGRAVIKNEELAEKNDELAKQLAAERDRRARLERVVPAEKRKFTNRPAKITSANTFYDRKEGYAVFTGRVHVDDEQYQLHADKAYVFMDSTNSLRRLVAMGNVAITNDTKRAYGAKASYYKQSGMVVLYSGNGRAAEVRDESKVDDQVVIGDKIKFWTGKEQVEVIKAHISAPVDSMSKDALNIGK